MTSAPDERGIIDARGPSPGSKDEVLMRELRLQRNLKILVATLGFLIFAGLGGIAWKMMGLSKERAANAGASTTAAAKPGSSEIALELPKGARVVSTSISGIGLPFTLKVQAAPVSPSSISILESALPTSNRRRPCQGIESGAVGFWQLAVGGTRAYNLFIAYCPHAPSFLMPRTPL